MTWYVWGGSSVIAEYNSGGWTNPLSWAKSYIYAGSRLLSTLTKNGTSETLEFHHPDRLGTRLVTNNMANTSFEQNTLPFGTALGAETTGTTNQRFTSYDRSTVASLDYAVNRSYSSGQGRFTSVDPTQMGSTSIDDPQSMNLYSYTQNNPIDFVDPTGLFRMVDWASCVTTGYLLQLVGFRPGEKEDWIPIYQVVGEIQTCGTYDADPTQTRDDPIPQSAVDDVVKRGTTGECGDYVKRFLDELRKLGVKLYENGDLSKIANRPMKSRTISDTDLQGQPWGGRGGEADAGTASLFGGSNRRIKIRRSTEGTQATLAHPTFTLALLHETLHHASEKGTVSDQKFAEAARNIAQQDGTLTEKLKTEKELKEMSNKQKTAYYSKYAQTNFFNRHCKGQ